MHGDMPLKLSQLLNARQHLQRCARLANLAFAFQWLNDCASRLERAQLTGLVNLKSAESNDEACWASLTALEGNQSLIEEHFTDEDVMDLADTIGYILDCETLDVTFRIEEFAAVFVAPLRVVLEDAGVTFESETCALEHDIPFDLPNNFPNNP